MTHLETCFCASCLSSEPQCVACGEALIPGLNTDFCSLACEEAHETQHGRICEDCGEPTYNCTHTEAV